MNSTTPEQTIVDYLAQPSLVVTPRHLSADSVLHGKSSWGGMEAEPETFQFLKARSIPGWQLHAVSFATRAGQQMFFAATVRQNDDGTWHFEGGGGGGLVFTETAGTSRPMANLGGLKGDALLSMGGQVHGQQVARVRLLAADGAALEDTVEHGIVLFLTTQPFASPMRAELYDHVGNPIGSHKVNG